MFGINFSEHFNQKGSDFIFLITPGQGVTDKSKIEIHDGYGTSLEEK